MAQPTVSRLRRASMPVKIETTYAANPTLAAADIVLVENAVFTALQEQARDERLSGLVAQLPDIPGGRTASIRGDAKLRGAGVAYSASVKPEVDALLRSMGFAAAGAFGVGTEKWDYTPQSGATLGESVTAGLYHENAPTGVILGAYGRGRIAMRAGAPAVISAELTGLYVEPTTETLLTATLPTVMAPVFRSGVVTFDAVTTFRVSSVDLDIGNDLQYLPSANDAQAYAGVIIADRRLVLTLDPEAVAVATYNFANKRDTQARVAVSWQIGTVQYNRILFSAPKVQILSIAETRRNGLLAYQLTCLLNADVGGDELKISFT